jgi:5-methylcytosine-specific restriction endonuclease McrA
MNDEDRDAVFGTMQRVSEAVAGFPYPYRKKPILGGAFGFGGYSICSYFEVDQGLDRVVYFVMHDASGFVLGCSPDVTEAMALARAALTKLDGTQLQVRYGRFMEWLREFRAERERMKEQALAERLEKMRSERVVPIKTIPRRRRQIFEEGGGKCHYCATPLTLEGPWHVEHKMPKALGGGNEPSNLVAACTACNHEKNDTTDIEYKAKRAARGQT